MCPSHIWYLMLASEVSPTSGNIDDPRATGKNRKAQTMFPTRPNLSPAAWSLAAHLFIKSQPSSLRIRVWHNSWDVNLQSGERWYSYKCSPSLTVLEFILEKLMYRKEEIAQIKRAMNMEKKANSNPETIPSGPLISTGRLHKSRWPALLLLQSNSILLTFRMQLLVDMIIDQDGERMDQGESLCGVHLDACRLGARWNLLM